jgi:DNA helicase-2/ATP-dependent DNA helicase PcrA
MTNKISLNKRQKEAVVYDKGPLLIVAGAGTGKTTVLLERIKYLISQKNKSPDNILALTFTDAAATEMLERLDLIMPLGYKEPWISTFHKFCDRILREEGLEIGLSPDFSILNPAQAYILFKNNLFDLKLKYFLPLSNPTKFIWAILKFFSRAQDENVGPDQLNEWVKSQKQLVKEEKQRWQELAITYQKWQKIKEKENFLDFGDLIMQSICLLSKRPNIAHKYQQQFEDVLVDEFQDTNYAQLQLLKLLADPKINPNLVVVGDDFQAVYKWRGAAVSNIMDFNQHYSTAKSIVLNLNYRSTQPLLDKSYHFIKHNEPETLEVKLKIKKKLKAVRQEKVRPIVAELNDIYEEANFVVDKILELVSTKNYTYQDFAILARANNHLDPFAGALKNRGIPYQLSTNRGLFDKEIIRSLLFLAKLILEPKNSSIFWQVLNISFFGISSVFILDLLSQSRAVGEDLYEYSKNKLKSIGMDSQDKEKLSWLISMIEKYQKQVLKKSASQLLFELIHELAWVKALVKNDSLEKQMDIKNLNLFFKLIKEFEHNNQEKSLLGFIDWINVLEEAGVNPSQAEVEDIDTVSLSTIHSAKGREWPAVFVVNLVKDRFPTRRRSDPIEFPDELAGEELPEGDSHLLEERRLFYVGCTRAKNELIVTLAKDYGGKREKKASIFIAEFGIKPKILKASNEIQCLISKPKKVKPLQVTDGKLKLHYLSYSQLDVFQSCPLKYKYRYILRVPSKPHHALTFGISVHEALHYFHQLELKGFQPKWDDLELFYKNNFRKEGYESKKHKAKRYQQGKKQLKKYFCEYKNIFTGKPAKLEQSFRLKILDIPLIGKIDRIDKLPDGSYELVDYKTGSAKTQSQVDKDAQLTLYAMAAKWSLGLETNKLSLFFLDGCKKISTSRSDKQLKSKFAQIQKVYKQIKKSKFGPKANFPMPCKYCEYSQICPFAKKS